MTLENASNIIKNLQLVEKFEKFNEEFIQLKKPKIRSIGHYYYEKFFGKRNGIFKTSVCTQLNINRQKCDVTKNRYGQKLNRAAGVVWLTLMESMDKSIESKTARLAELRKELGDARTDDSRKQQLKREEALCAASLERLTKLHQGLGDACTKEGNLRGMLQDRVLREAVTGDEQFAVSFGPAIAVLGHCYHLHSLMKNKIAELDRNARG